jgi:hypothetical protein
MILSQSKSTTQQVKNVHTSAIIIIIIIILQLVRKHKLTSTNSSMSDGSAPAHESSLEGFKPRTTRR